MNSPVNEIGPNLTPTSFEHVSIFDAVRIYLVKCGMEGTHATNFSEQVVRGIQFDNSGDTAGCVRVAIAAAIDASNSESFGVVNLPQAVPAPGHAAMRKADPYRVVGALNLSKWFRLPQRRRVLSRPTA